MKRLIAVGLTMALVLGATLPPRTRAEQAGETKADGAVLSCPYFPLKVGSTWEYLSGTKKALVKVAAHEKVDGVMCARIESDLGGGMVTEHITVKDDGVYRMRANNQDIKPPLLVLKLAAKGQPLTKGESWSVDSTIRDFAIKGKFTVTEDKVTVGKTEYATISVKASDLKMGDQVAAMETWYAKEVGMVKQHFKLPVAEMDVVLELEKFTPGQ